MDERLIDTLLNPMIDMLCITYHQKDQYSYTDEEQIRLYLERKLFIQGAYDERKKK
jgi:hypothetical protein